MADSAADVLGTPDIPANLAAVAPTGDATGVPTAIAAPATGTDMPTPMGSTPGTEVPASTDPEVAAGAVHQNWLSRILDSVGTILGGDKTIVATKHPDGSVSVEHNPSTTGEKWGRIAQAALGGAARGMAVGQGPGGAGRAFAAGGLAGLQQPQQALDAANKEAANMNAEQLAIANTALTHQKLVQTMLASRDAGLSLGAKESEILQGISDAAGAGPNTIKVGTFTDMAGIMKALQSNPAAMAGLTNQALKVFPTADTEGHVQLEAYLVDKGADNRKNDKIEKMPYTDVDPTTHEPILKSRDIGPQSQPLVQIRQAQQAATAQFIDMHNKWRTAESTADKKETDPMPKSAQEAQAMADLATDPTRKQTLLNLVPKLQKLELEQKQAGRAPSVVVTPGMGTTPGGEVAYQPGRNPVLDDTAEGLASGRYLQSTLPKRTGKGQPTPQEQNYAANIISQQKYGLPYNPTIIDQENNFAKAPKTQAYLEGIDRMTGAHGDPGQLNQLLNLAQAAGIGGNAPLNDIKQAVRTRLGSEAADNFATLLTETQSNLGTLIGNPLLGSGESDQKLRTAKSAFGQNPTLDSLRGQVATVSDVLNRSRQNMAANNRYIQQRYGNRLSPSASATPAATGNTSQAARQPATGYQQGVNTPQFPIAQSADGKTRTQWNGTTWATLP